ncbi:MAG: hypothetical protein H6728_04400 [Myxococcales bacterium]|nr:hypothetical protein [Myxococcales bacterium]MCB9642293.1 hypothetical protein [Myxococcales bacterium]
MFGNHIFRGRASVWLGIAGVLLFLWACQDGVGIKEGGNSEPTQGRESSSETIVEPEPISQELAPEDAGAEVMSEDHESSLPETEPSENSVEGDAKPQGECGELPELPSDKTWTVEVDGTTRYYRVFVPSNYDRNKATPLVLNFHGVSNDAYTQVWLSGMESKAELAGFIAVHPEGGTLPSRSWNAGNCCQPAAALGIDDVSFVRAMLDDLSKKLCIDKRRIFATGISNGGMLAYRLACEVSDRIAAIAPVAASMVFSPCKPPRAVPVMMFHGTLDSVVPYAGNPFLLYPSVSSNTDHWVEHNQCQDKKERTFDQGDAYCDAYKEGCKDDATVEVCTVLGGGHTWPGGMPVPQLGYTSLSLDATDAMWTFFQKHPMPVNPSTP